MSVQEILQIFGGIGVIASIVFAGLQIRRNTIAMRAAANHNISLTFINMWLDLAINAEFTELALRGGEEFHSMTRIEKVRVRFQFMVFMRIYENAYFQHKLGILKDADWEAIIGDMRSFCTRPKVPDIWALVSNRSGADFRGFVDKLLAEIAASKLAATETEPAL